MCGCIITGHPDLKYYKLTNDTSVIYANSTHGIIDITIRAVNSALGDALHIEPANKDIHPSKTRASTNPKMKLS